jgi:hypothetical protein
MTPPHPAWVFSETRAILFKDSCEGILRGGPGGPCSPVFPSSSPPTPPIRGWGKGLGEWAEVRDPGPFPQRLFPTTSLARGHEHQAGEDQGNGGDSAPLLPALVIWRRRLRIRATPRSRAAHAGEHKHNEAYQGQNLPEAAFFHAFPITPLDYDKRTCRVQAGMVPGWATRAERGVRALSFLLFPPFFREAGHFSG